MTKMTRRTALILSASTLALYGYPDIVELDRELTLEEIDARPGRIILLNAELLWVYQAWLCRERMGVAMALSRLRCPNELEIDDLACRLPPSRVDIIAGARMHLDIDGMADWRPAKKRAGA